MFSSKYQEFSEKNGTFEQKLKIFINETRLLTRKFFLGPKLRTLYHGKRFFSKIIIKLNSKINLNTAGELSSLPPSNYG